MNATDAIRTGKLIVLPTDTVYGIGANPLSRDAVTKLLLAKGRGETMPPPLLCADAETAMSFIDPRRLPEGALTGIKKLTETFWPGPLTLIVPTDTNVGWETEATGDTVAVRVPDDQNARQLLQHTGPLAVTSANLTGRPPANSVGEAREYFGEKVAVYIDGGPAKIGEASTIADCSVWPPRELRAGALEWSQVLRALEGIE